MKKIEKIFVATLIVIFSITGFIIGLGTTTQKTQDENDSGGGFWIIYENDSDVIKYANSMQFLELSYKLARNQIEPIPDYSDPEATQIFCVFTSFDGFVLTAKDNNVTEVYTNYKLSDAYYEFWFDCDLKIGTQRVRVITSNEFQQIPQKPQ